MVARHGPGERLVLHALADMLGLDVGEATRRAHESDSHQKSSQLVAGVNEVVQARHARCSECVVVAPHRVDDLLRIAATRELVRANRPMCRRLRETLVVKVVQQAGNPPAVHGGRVESVVGGVPAHPGLHQHPVLAKGRILVPLVQERAGLLPAWFPHQAGTASRRRERAEMRAGALGRTSRR